MSNPPQNKTQSLLNDIFNETASLAQKEDEQLQRQQQALHHAQTQKKEHQEQAHQQRAAQMLHEEKTRQKHAAQRRTDMLRAIEGPSRQEQEAIAHAKAEAQARATLETQLLQAEQARQAAEQRAAQAIAAIQHTQQPPITPPQPKPHNPHTLRLALGASAMACVGALALAGLGFFFLQNNTPTPSTYHKLAYSPSSLTVSSVTHGFEPFPELAQPLQKNPKQTRRHKPSRTHKKTPPIKPIKGVIDFGGNGDNVFNPKKQ